MKILATNVRYPIRSFKRSNQEIQLMDDLKHDYKAMITNILRFINILQTLNLEQDLEVYEVANNIAFCFDLIETQFKKTPFWPTDSLFKFVRDIAKIFLLKMCWIIEL